MRATESLGRSYFRRRSLALVSIMALATAALSACSSSSSGGGTPSGGTSSGGGASASAPTTPGSPIKIALIAPFSGPESYLGPTTKDGLILALNQVGGKVGNRPIQIVDEDDQCTPTNAIQIVQKVVSDSSFSAVFGPACSGSFTATQSMMAKKGLVHVTNSYASTITQQGDKYVIQGVPNNGQIADAMLPYIASKHPSSVGLLVGDDGYDADVAKKMKEQLSQANIKVSYQGTFDDAATNWSGEVAAYKNSGAKLLFVAAYEATTGQIVKQFRQEGVTDPIVGELACDPEAVTAGGSELTDTAFALNYCPTFPGFAQFNKQYKAQHFKGSPVDVTASAYITGLALFKGLQGSNGQGGSALMAAIHNLNFSTPAGPVSFTPEGALTDPDLITGIMTDGKATFQKFN